MKLAVPDMISNSYFPAIAAVELGFFKAGRARCRARADLSGRQVLQGAARRRGRFRRRLGAFGAGGVPRMAGREAAVRAGAGHVLVPGHALRLRRQARRHLGRQGPAHRRRAVGRDGAHASADRGRHRSRARQRQDRAGAGRCAVPGAVVNFGVTAAKALEDAQDRRLLGERHGRGGRGARGVGTVVLDVRRGDGPKPCFNYTMASIATTDALIARSPEAAAGAVRAIVKTQAALKQNVARARRGRQANCSRRIRGRADRRADPPRSAVLRSRRSRASSSPA